MAGAFVFLIPGYFLYHWLSKLDLIPMLLAGYTIESAALVLAWAALWALPSLVNGTRGPVRLCRAEVLFGAFMLFFGFLVSVHWMNDTAPKVSVSHTGAMLQLMAMFVVFRFAPLGSPSLHRVLQLTVVLMSLLVYNLAATDEFGQFFANNDDPKSANYQGLSRMFMLTVLVIAAFTPSLPSRVLHYLNATVVIFLLGARSELVALLVFAATCEWMLTRRKGLRYLLLTLLMGTMVATLPNFFSLLKDLLPDNRALSLLEFESDGSVLARDAVNSFALETIAAYPILGDYGSYAVLGGAGNYAHNILSVWVDLGIAGMGLLVSLLVLLLVTYFKMRKRRFLFPSQSAALRLLGTGLLAQVLFFLVAAKNFTDVSIAIVVGVTGLLYAQLRADGCRANAARDADSCVVGRMKRGGI